MYQKGRAWIELDRKNLASNLEQLKALLPEGCTVMPAVKANAYGHGAVLIGKALQDMGIQDFCVASVREAAELREAGITGQILVLGYTSPQEFSELSYYNLTQTVVDFPYAKQLQAYGRPLAVHVGVDTGMNRLGERSENIENICRIWELKHLKVTGVFSHFCVADGASEGEKIYTHGQITKFDSVIRQLKEKGISGFKTHIQGSYGILNYPELRYDYVRPGIALCGVLSSPEDKTVSAAHLKPVLSLKARIACVKQLHAGEKAGYGQTYTAEKERKTAVVSIGYADGIPRELSNRGQVLVNGYRAPMIGRICMDQLLIDVSEIPHVSPGDEAVLIGKCGAEQITAGELARMVGTISNEILSRLGGRLERITAGMNDY